MPKHRQVEITQWGRKRGINSPLSDPMPQVVKLGEEIGEAYEAEIDGEMDELKDGIGDSVVVLYQIAEIAQVTIRPIEHLMSSSVFGAYGKLCRAVAKNDNVDWYVSEMYELLDRWADAAGLSVDECIEAAWNEIKNRTGKTVNGVFVKETDSAT